MSQFVENDLSKFLSFFTSERGDPAFAGAMCDAILAADFYCSEKIVDAVKNTPLETLVYQVQRVDHQKWEITESKVNELISTLEITKADIDSGKRTHQALCQEIERLVASKEALDVDLARRIAERDDLVKHTREARDILTTPRCALVQEVLDSYVQSFGKKRPRTYSDSTSGKRARRASFLGTEEFTAAQNLLNLHNARQATVGGP